MLLFCFIWCLVVGSSRATPVSPRIPLRSLFDQTAIFKTFIPYAQVPVCNITWKAGIIPPGNSFEKKSPSQVEEIVYDKITTFSGLVIKNDALKSIIVTYRPACSKMLWWFTIKQWRSDVHALTPFNMTHPTKKIPEGMSIHHGFQLLYMRIRPIMLRAIKKAADENPGYQIMFVAASLGAAVAEISAIDFAFNFEEEEHRIETITFGTPRVGNRAWANFVDSFNFRKSRLVTANDPVPHVPPRIFGYRHSHQEYTLHLDGTVSLCPEIVKGSGGTRQFEIANLVECKRHDYLHSTVKNHYTITAIEILGLEAFNCGARPIGFKQAIRPRDTMN